MTGLERDQPKKKKKKIILSSVPSKPELEHSQKNSKKIQKIKKRHSSIISKQTGLR